MNNTMHVAITGAPNPEFDQVFQYQLVAHMLKDPGFFRTNAGWLTADYFSLIECKLVLQAIYDFYLQYHALPSLQTLGLYLTETTLPSGIITWTQEDVPSICRLLEHISALQVLETAYYQDRVQHFVKEVQVHELMRDAAEQGFGNQSELIMSGLERIKRDTANRGVFKLTSASVGNPGLIDRQSGEIRIPTGLQQLDRQLSGGLAPKEIGMVTACTGVGKSNTLTNFILSGIVNGWRTLIISTELPIAKLKRRFQAMVTGIKADFFKYPVEDWPTDILQRYSFFKDTAYRWRGMDSFFDASDREYSMTEIEQIIISWKENTRDEYGEEEAAKCKLVCIDWLDYISANGLGLGNNVKMYEKLSVLPRELGFIARRTDVALWTATQGTRDADGKEILNLTHTSGAYAKNAPLDVSLGLGRVNDDETYGDIEEYDAVINDDDDQNPPCDRDLVMSLMKGRESSKAGQFSFKLYQGPSLRFWNSRAHMEQLGAITPEKSYLYPDILEKGVGIRKQRVIL